MKYKILGRYLTILLINLLLIGYIFCLNNEVDSDQEYSIDISEEEKSEELEISNDDEKELNLETYIKVKVDSSSSDKIVLDLDVKDIPFEFYFYLSNNLSEINEGLVEGIHAGYNHSEIRISDLEDLSEFYIQILIKEKEVCEDVKGKINKTLRCRSITNLSDIVYSEEKICFFFEECYSRKNCSEPIKKCVENREEEAKKMCVDGMYRINIYNIIENCTRLKRKYILSYHSEKYDYYRIKDNDIFLNKKYSTFIYENNIGIIKNNKKIILTALGSGLNNFNFNYSIVSSLESSEIKESPIIIKKNFFNGYAFIIDFNKFNKTEENVFIKFQLSSIDNNEVITIKTRRYLEIVTINDLNNHFDIKLEANEIKKECFKFNENINNEEQYVINFLSLTKNINFTIKTDNTNEIKTELPIDKESMIHLINTQESNSFCFEISNNNNVYDFGSLSFDVKKINSEIKQFYIIRGLPTHQHLESDTAVFYRPKYYINSQDINIKVKFHMTKGNSKLYLTSCTEENCPVLENINELIPYHDINGFISIKENIPDENWGALVQCFDVECEFDIEMKEETEKTYLYQNLRLFSFIEKDNEKFIINTKELSNQDILININSFNKEPNVLISFDGKNNEEFKPEEDYFMENKLVYKINKDVFKNKEYLYVEVNGNTSYYYGIFYEINNPNHRNLENGVLYYKELDGTTFNFINKNEECDTSNILNVNTFGNDLELIYNDNKIPIPSYNNLINLEIDNCKSFQINVNNGESNDFTGNPLFNMVYNENSNHNKILIEHGYIYMNRLNSNNNIAVYSLIYFKGQDNVNNLYVINFRKYSDINLTLSYNNDNKKNINELSKMIILEENNINNCYKNNKYLYEYCELIIEIETNQELNDDEEIDFSIQVIKYEKNPRYIYLPQNTFMSNMLISGFTQIYYTYIKQNEEEKIYIDFLEGEGTAYAEIKDKDNNDLYSNNISFDFYNKYLDINEEYTSNCGKKGCVIYIYVNLDKDTDSKYKYNIYSKKKIENAYFNVPETEYIFGHLENNVDYYKTKIKSNKLVFHINCDDCTLTIENTKKSVNISMNQEYQVYLIDGQEKTVKYNIKKNNIISNQRYYIKVISYTNELYIPVNSIRNEFCIFKLNNPCYFLIQKEHYNKVKTLRFLVTNNENIELKVEKTVINDLNELSVNENIKKDKYILNNENICEKTNYCEDGIENDKDEEIIYIIKVSLNHDDFITFVSDQYEVNSELKNYIYKEDYMIISLDTEKDSTEISPLKPVGILRYDINLIKGKGYINQLKEGGESYYLESGFKENLNLLFKKTETESSIEVHANDNNNFIFYLRIIVNSNEENNLAELSFQRNNYFKFLNNTKDLKNWPLHFYMRINTNNLNDLNDINFNYKFSFSYKNNLDSSNTYEYFEEIYNATVYLVDQNFIINKKFNNIEELNDPLNIENNYRRDFTSGYSLITADSISNKIKNSDNNYLYIIIEKHLDKIEINEDEISVVLTLFDFTQNYFLPMNEYLLMEINEERTINIREETNNNYYPFIEFALNNTNYEITPGAQDIQKYGKTFLNITENKSYKMKIENNEDYPYFYMKHGLSYNNNLSYFLINEEIEKEKDIIIKFSPVEEHPDNIIQNNISPYIIYNIKIYNLSQIPQDILENNETYQLIKMINIEEDKSYNISKFIDYGEYSLSILAEARKGDIYEYLSYKPITIEYIAEEKYKDIIINYEGDYYVPQFSKDIKFTATIESNETDKDFIKLTLRHNNYLEEDNYIFVSEDKELLNSGKDKLYENSQYRLLKRETSLIIPVKKLQKLNERKLYIRIPCKNVCNYVFNYTLYTKENISIYNNECFDMDLDNDEDPPYTFQYNLKEENKFSLFTLASYSLLDKFKVTTDGNNKLKESFFNGYSSYVDHNDYLTQNNKIVNFRIKHNNLKLKICHKFTKDEDYTKEIFNGDIKYTILEHNEKECYQIYNDTYEDINKITNYRISFITKTKNLVINLDQTNNDGDYEIYEESKTIIIPKSNNKFCIINRDAKEGSALFQLLSKYEDSYYNQSMNMPLIEGVSTKQKLQKGDILFYKLNDNINNAINIHFQNLSGIPKLYYHELEKETKDLNFTDQTIKNLELRVFKGINNNIYYNKKKDDNKIPITIVHCDSDECVFYIEMSYDKQTILLNNNRKIYSFYKKEEKNVQNNQDEQDLNLYKIDLPVDQIKSDKNKKIYIQLYSLTGDLELNIQEYSLSDHGNNYHNYNNNTRLFITKLEKSNKFNIEISGKNNSYYNIFYYIIDVNNENNIIYLPSGEVQYNILPKSNIQYYFQDESIQESLNYMVTLNSINCDLKVNGKINEQSSKYFQLYINSGEKVQISSQIEDLEDKCEFTISAVQLKSDGSLKELIFNERTYQYYNYNWNKFNSIKIKYFLSDLKEKSDKHVSININKKSDNNLILNYTINGKEFKNKTNKYNEMIKINLEDLKEMEKKIGNLYEFDITVESEDHNDIEFKIKITEDKELYSYLDYEDIEYGIIEKGKLHNYYYEYFGNNNEVNEQIYLDCKGPAKIDNILIKDTENNYLDLKEKNNFYTKNYISIMKGNEFINCEKGCKIYFSIIIPFDNNNTDSNEYNIYIMSSNKKLNVFENINIYGYLDSNFKFLFKTPIYNENYEEIPFNLNCMKCTVTIYNVKDSEKKDFSFYNSIIIDNSSNKRKELIYPIETQNAEKCYFYFSVIDPNKPKYIYQKESIISKPNIRFILPLYTYYSYNKDNILLYAPDNEKVIIYEKIIEKKNLNDTYLNEFDLLEDSDHNSKNLLKTNRLFVDITNYYNKDSYMLIQIESNYDYNFTFIVSEFYKSFDDNNEKIYPHNIFTLKNESKQFINNSYKNYKIKMHLINGSGFISLSENEDEVYELNYENQETIYCLNNNGYLKANSSINEDIFIFYLEIKKKEFKYNYDLVIQKANHLKILNQESINLKFENIKNKDLFINLHFLKLERDQTTSDAIKIEDNFKLSLNGLNNKESRSAINYKGTKVIRNPFRRGFIHINSAEIDEDSKYILLSISNFTYSKINLEVTPLYINKNDDELLELPRNAYLELEADYIDNIYFSKPNEKYNNVKIELGYINNYNLNLISLSLNKTDYMINQIGGKYYYNINDESLKYKIKLNDTKGNILLKYTTKKDNNRFYLTDEEIKYTLIDESKGIFKINYDNIKNTNSSINNYKLSYMFVLYDWLEFYDNKEIVNILVNVTDNITLRKELTDEDKLKDKLEYVVEFGNLPYAEFCICVIGEVYYNDNIEYFTYKFDTYLKKKPKHIEFDKNWVYPLIIVVLIFVVVVFFLIRAYIKRRNETNNDTGKFLLNKVKDNNIEVS